MWIPIILRIISFLQTLIKYRENIKNDANEAKVKSFKGNVFNIVTLKTSLFFNFQSSKSFEISKN